MDRNKDAKLTFDEFKEGSKQDPTIVQVSTCLPATQMLSHSSGTANPMLRPYRCMMVWYDLF